jgi:cytochrome c-type biogenesis protein CcsB
MPLPPVTLLAPACAYLAAGALYIVRVLRRDARAASAAFVLGIVGVALHAVVVLSRLTEGAQAVGSTVPAAASFISFLTAAAFLVAQRPFRLAALGAAVMPICFGGALYAAVVPGSGAPTDKVLHSPWFFVHVPPVLLAYVALAFSFAIAALYLGETRLLRSRRLAAVLGVLPPLDQLENAMYRTAAFGFLLLTVGLATGALWAQDVWGRYWNWEPKQTASLVTWLIFATYLHYRVVRGARGRNGAWLIVVGFVCIVLTFLAVGLFTDDRHRFL